MFSLSKLLKNILPKSLFGRFLIIIVAPMVLAQIFVTYIFYERHWDSVSIYMAESFSGEIRLTTDLILTKKGEEREKIVKLIEDLLAIKINFYDDENFIQKKKKSRPTEFGNLSKLIEKKIKKPFNISYINDKSFIKVDILTNKKEVISIVASIKRIDTPTTHIFIMWMIGISFVLLFLAIIFLKNQINPIRRLSIAAEQFGKGHPIKFFKPEGASEVRKAAIAFLKMKDRIERQINQRTEMLAGVSHDLRTPLTRIKLQIALMDKNEEIIGIEQDINEMEKMIEAYLNFARGEGNENLKLIEVEKFFNQIIKSTKKPALEINFYSDHSLYNIWIRENAFKRAIINLIENACKYSNIIEIKFTSDKEKAIITIEDNGPGIEEDKRELVFKPFFKLDKARNPNIPGVGLGLTIARDIISAHGGKIILDHSTHLGGLKAIIILPL